VRERGGAGVGGGKGRAGLSDDDKIRLQLYVDVMYFARFNILFKHKFFLVKVYVFIGTGNLRLVNIC
jgi:hypothetical protein